MAVLRRVLGSSWTVVAGFVLVIVGVAAFVLGGPEEVGWFTYFEENASPAPTLVARFGTGQVAGLALAGIGLVVIAASMGYRLGSRAENSTSFGGDQRPA